ncbi:MAG: hypothetical protein WBQ45_13545 [Roseiarcus sp.]|uniref:hypothetical protein n=1 Tax=Roseiarcus sp. TaxID=1969460 RepID=UPI003BB0BB01
MRSVFFSAAVTALALGASIGGAEAAQVLTPDGDPFPTNSVAYLTGGPYMTPFGTFDMTTVANFDGFVLQSHSGNEFYTYATSTVFGTVGPTQTVTFDNHGVFSTYTFTNGDVEVEIFGRSSAFETGTFSARMLMATWTGTIDGLPVVAQISPATPTLGTIIFSLPPPGTLGLLVDYVFHNQTEFSLNGGPFVSTPLTGVSAPIPEASTWAMILAGFAGLAFASYRRSTGKIRLRRGDRGIGTRSITASTTMGSKRYVAL